MKNIPKKKKDIKEIVEELAKDNHLKKMTKKLLQYKKQSEHTEDLEDLWQDIFVQLLTNKTERTEELYQQDKLKYYIFRIIQNNIISNTSRYHTVYRKPRIIATELPREDDDTED